MKRLLAISATVAIVFIILLLFAFDTRLKIVNYQITSEKVSGSVKLAFVTDLHNCLYGENQSQLLDAMNLLNPDAVLLGGDIFDDIYVNDNSRIFIDAITSKYQTYYVSGNHEWWSGKMYEYFDYLNSAGVRVLRGDSERLNINGNNILISGIDDLQVNSYEDGITTTEKQLAKITDADDSECYHILLSHRPEHAREYLSYGFDLMLSGHAHGGQAIIPFILNGFYAPNQGFFPEFAGGLYEFGSQKLIVSRGLSRENTKLPRVFNRPELVFISINK